MRSVLDVVYFVFVQKVQEQTVLQSTIHMCWFSNKYIQERNKINTFNALFTLSGLLFDGM